MRPKSLRKGFRRDNTDIRTSYETISNGWFILPSPENTISDLSEITGRRA